MSFSIKEGVLPHWDERLRYTLYLDKDETDAQTLNYFARLSIEPYNVELTNQVAMTKRLSNLSVDDLFIIVKECLRDYQGYHRLDPHGSNWRVQFPYARYLSKGDLVRNLTTKEVYTVDRVFDAYRKDVLLSGVTYPKATDKLRIPKENEIDLKHGFPRSFVSSQGFDTSSEHGDKPEPFNDTITFLVKKSDPKSLSKTPFGGGSKQLGPTFRETKINPENPDEVIEIEGFPFHSTVCFDCWARDNKKATELIAWFEDFMFKTKWIYELWGISKIFYWGRREDEEVYRWRSDITKRTVEYLVETERIFLSRSTRLKEVSVQIAASGNVEYVDPEDVYSDDILIWPDPSSNVVSSIVEYAT